MARRILSLALLGLAASLVPAPLHADRLVTTDGRILQVKKARLLENGNYMLTFEAGAFECPASSIASVEIEGDMSDYVPTNEDERQKLEAGYVRFEGKWLSKARYQTMLAKQAEERRERVEKLAKHSEMATGYELETKHFLLRSNTSEELIQYYGNLLEAYYKLMDDEFGIKPTPTLKRTKMRVNVYKNAEDFREGEGTRPGVAGYFDRLGQLLCFYHEYDDPGFTNWVGLHEGTHLLTYLIEPQSWAGIWYNEGIADYFGSADVEIDDRGRITITPGALQLDRVFTVQEAIRDDKYIRLEDLFKSVRNNYGAFEYAHGWSFIYFLNRTEKYQSGFKKFFRDVYTFPKGVGYTHEPFPDKTGTAKMIPNEEVRRLLLQNLKVTDVAVLEKEWLDFMKAIEIDAPSALFKRAYRAVRFGDVEQFEQAEKDLTTAISSGFEDARAYWARGLVSSWNKKGGVKGGIADFRKAVELDPLNAAYRHSLGEVLAGYSLHLGGASMSVRGDQELFGEREEFEQADLQLGLATELDPENENYRTRYEDFLRRFGRLLEEAD